jgi:predicted nucleotidyltransferase component of viral defense system
VSYQSPAALKDALEARLRNEARDRNIDLGRLRRRVVFERLLVRLESAQPGRWIVKGAIALEVRLKERARTTKDLDLALRDHVASGEEVRDLLIEGTANDLEGDGFSFTVGPAKTITAQMGGLSWGFSVAASLAGGLFAQVTLDVVAKPEETTLTERIALPGAFVFAGFPVRQVDVVSPTQHFAEKLHALTRTYGERPSSRVRDLVDLMLLIEEGFDNLDELYLVVERVFRERATHALPMVIPDPPSSWLETYERLAGDVDIAAATVDEAMSTLRQFWEAVIKEGSPMEDNGAKNT